ncbi:hypothetical protein [Streptomyces sp. SD31]
MGRVRNNAVQRKLDAIAEALGDVYKGEQSEAVDRLRDAIRMEEET